MDEVSSQSIDPALMGMLDDEFDQMKRDLAASHSKREMKHQRQMKNP